MSFFCGAVGPARPDLSPIADTAPDCYAAASFRQSGPAAFAWRPSPSDGHAQAFQPFGCTRQGREYVIVYDGRLSNASCLARMVRRRGLTPPDSEASLILALYLLFGQECTRLLNGVFAFAIYDGRQDILFMARDRLGIKTLYYSVQEQGFVFSTMLESMFAFPGVQPHITAEGMDQLLILSPPGEDGVFRGIHSLSPGQSAILRSGRLTLRTYWKLEAKPVSLPFSEAQTRLGELWESILAEMLTAAGEALVLLDGSPESALLAITAAGHLPGKSLDTCGPAPGTLDGWYLPSERDALIGFASGYLGSAHQALSFPTMKAALDEPAEHIPCFSADELAAAILCREAHSSGGQLFSAIGAEWLFENLLQAEDAEELFAPERDGSDAKHRWLEQRLKACPSRTDDSPAMRAYRRRFWFGARYRLGPALSRLCRLAEEGGNMLWLPFADHRLLEALFCFPPSGGGGSDALSPVCRYFASRIPRVLQKQPLPFSLCTEARKAIQEQLRKELSDGCSIVDRMVSPELLHVLSAKNAFYYLQLSRWCRIHRLICE